MNYIDIAILGIFVLFFVSGFLFRKCVKTLYLLMLTLAYIPLSFVLSGIVLNALESVDLTKAGLPFASIDGLIPYIRTLNPTITDMFNASPALTSIVENWSDILTKFIGAYVIFIILVITTFIFGSIVWLVIGLIIPKKIKEKKVRLVTAVLNGIRGVVIIAVLLVPFYNLRNAASELENLNIIPEEDIEIVKTYNEQTNGSKFFAFVEKNIGKTINNNLTYKENNKEYDINEEILDMVDIINVGFESMDSFKDLDFDTNNINPKTYVDTFEKLDGILTKIDLTISNLRENSQVSNAISELVPFILDEYLIKEIDVFSSVNLDNLEFTSFKEDVVPLLLKGLLNSLSSDYPFLANIEFKKSNGSDMTYAEIKNEILTLMSMTTVFNSLSGLADGSLNLEDIDTEALIDALKSGQNSELVNTLITDVGKELSEEFDVNIDLTDVDFASEAEILGSFIDMAKDPESVELEDIANTLVTSSVALELAKTADIQVDVEQAKFDEIKAELESNVNASQENIAAVLALFNVK